MNSVDQDEKLNLISTSSISPRLSLVGRCYTEQYMKQVSKAVIVNSEDQYLLMQRNDHPVFGYDADLPGGTGEQGESTAQTMVREASEEIGLTITEEQLRLLYAGTAYSQKGTHQALYSICLDSTPVIALSDEHSSFEWLDKETFLQKSSKSKDPYMHMVYDVVRNHA